jgi:hypothetical protein
MISIAGLPFWDVDFDEHGVPAARDLTLESEIAAGGVTDLIVFAHGWNNDREVAHQLYEQFFGTMAGQLPHLRTDRPVRIGLAGVYWPSERWSDEPLIFSSPAPPPVQDAAGLRPSPAPAPAPSLTPRLDPSTLASLRRLFPAAAAPLERLAAILTGPPSTSALREFHQRMSDFATAAGITGADDGESAGPGESPVAAMLRADPAELFRAYGDALRQSGAGPTADGSGAAGLGDLTDLVLFGAKEALRQLTYWEMKNRAGEVGRNGLGPLLGRIGAKAPGLRIHLLGHSFGARLVSYALAGRPGFAPPRVSPVKSVTLMEGAFSQWAFARRLPFDPSRSGALADVPDRVDGPLVVTYSRHDTAVGTFYPMASMASDDDSAGLGDARSRWGAIGYNGAQGALALLDGVRGAGPGVTYPYRDRRLINIDASEVVCRGWAPAGAHGDIVHPELTWIVLTAAELTG